jgi:Ser/Thr protein kinase RdoA (MazF antagonist)
MVVNPLKRANFNISPSTLLDWVSQEYALGAVKDYHLMTGGLTEINFKLVTDQGHYLVKVFPDKDEARVKDILSSILAMFNEGIPVPKVYPSRQGWRYFKIDPSQDKQQLIGCVLSWFEGHDLVGETITHEQLRTISRWLAKINRLKLPIRTVYDPWFTTNLPFEFHNKAQFVPRDKYISIIEDIVDRLNGLDISQLHTGTVHGDLHREHVLQSKSGICVIDFGALNEGQIVIDLAIAMSHFCLDLDSFSPARFLDSYRTMLNEYLDYGELPIYEIKSLPLLVKASYAAYYVEGYFSYVIHEEEHAMYWIDIGKRGLEFVYPIEDNEFAQAVA